MTYLEFIESKIKANKSAIWLLMNSTDEELNLPIGVSKEEAIDWILEDLSRLIKILKKIQDEK